MPKTLAAGSEPNPSGWRVSRLWGYLTDRETVSRRLGVDLTHETAEAILQRVLRTCGLAGISQLTGQFAAVAEHEETTTTALIRDHIGLVPLYWARLGGQLVADADLTVLRDAAWDGSAIDRDVIAAYLMHQPAWPGQRTQYPGIRRVLPGSVTLIRGENVQSWTYFPGPPSVVATTLSPAAAVARMHDVVRLAVADATQGQPVACHLSGGLDSSVITAIAQSQPGVDLREVFTWTPAVEPGANPEPEQHLLRLVAEHLGLAPIHIDYADSRAELLALDPLLYPQWGYLEYELASLRLAEQCGATVVLSGWGGDDFASAPAPLDLWGFVRGGQLAPLWRHLGASPSGRTRTTISAVGGPIRRRLRSLARTSATPEWWPAWEPEFGHILAARRKSRATRAQDYQRNRARNLHLSARTDTWWLAGKERGITYRYPLLDQRVVRTALRMPPWYFRGDGASRWGFREIAREYLPSTALNASKSEPVRVDRLLQYDWGADLWRRGQGHPPELLDLTDRSVRNLQLRMGAN